MIRLNVLELLGKKGKSKYWLFNELNKLSPISYTNFNAIVTNKTKSIKYENIEKFCKILDCKLQDLFISED